MSTFAPLVAFGAVTLWAAGPAAADEEHCQATGPLPFTDVGADDWARADIACLHELAITGGTSPTTYSPDNLVDRDQMASFLARLWRALGED